VLDILMAVLDFLRDAGWACILRSERSLVHIEWSQENIYKRFGSKGIECAESSHWLTAITDDPYATIYITPSGGMRLLWWGIERGDVIYELEDPDSIVAVIIELRAGFATFYTHK